MAAEKLAPAGELIRFGARSDAGRVQLTILLASLGRLTSWPPEYSTAQSSEVHADNVESAIDVKHFAGDARRQIGAQKGCRVAHFVDGDVAP